MQLLLNRIHQQIGIDQFIEISSSKYGIDIKDIEQLTNNITSSLLASILIQGDTEQTNYLLVNYNSNITNLATIEDNRIFITSSFLNVLFNDKLDDLVHILSIKSNISVDIVRSLVIVLTHVYINQLLSFMLSEQFSINGLLGHLLGERDYYIDYIPEEIIPLLGVSSKHNLGQNISADAIVVSNAVRYTLLHEKREKEMAAAKEKRGWLTKIFRK